MAFFQQQCDLWPRKRCRSQYWHEYRSRKNCRYVAKADETETPLKNNLNELGKFLTIAIIVIAVIMFIVGTVINGTSFVDNAVNLDLFGSGCNSRRASGDRYHHLALGTQVMAKRNSVIRKLPAVLRHWQYGYYCFR